MPTTQIRPRDAACADTVGKDFRNQHPGNRRERHGIAADGAEREQKNGQAAQMQVIHNGQCDVDRAHAGAAQAA